LRKEAEMENYFHKKEEFRIVVGEEGNAKEHIIPVKGGTFSSAQHLLKSEMKKQEGQPWGRIEYRYIGQPENMWRKVEEN
jgi:hypothetical protein